MAATLTQERFTGPEWIFERKFDGIRLLAFKKGANVQLFSRNHLPQNMPTLAAAIAKLPHRELILDGEIDWHGPAAYHVFDIMWLDGRDVTILPLDILDSASGPAQVRCDRGNGSATLMRGKSATCRLRPLFFLRVSDSPRS